MNFIAIHFVTVVYLWSIVNTMWLCVGISVSKQHINTLYNKKIHYAVMHHMKIQFDSSEHIMYAFIVIAIIHTFTQIMLQDAYERVNISMCIHHIHRVHICNLNCLEQLCNNTHNFIAYWYEFSTFSVHHPIICTAIFRPRLVRELQWE